MREFETIKLDRADDRARVTLNRPRKVNALNETMFAELREVFEHLVEQDGIRVVALRGAGGDFSAGVDMSGVPLMLEEKPLTLRERLQDFHRCFETIDAFPRPVVGALEGYVLGGGLELSLCCDIRLAHTDAQFGLPESSMGLVPDLGSAQKLPAMIGEGMTCDLILTGEPISASRARDIRLVERIAPDGAFDDALDRLLDQIADKPGYALELAKEQIRGARPQHRKTGMNLSIHHAIGVYQEDETQRRVGEFLD